MPTILAIDTSSDACSVALSNIQGNIKESTIVAAREHTQRILPMIEKILMGNGKTLKELDAIAFGCGPGSFTGLRICLSIAQGLAYGADLPLIPVSSLEAMAMGALRLHKPLQNAYIIPVIDARMDEVYWSAYKVKSPLELELLSNDLTSLSSDRLTKEGAATECVMTEDSTANNAGYINTPEDCYQRIVTLDNSKIYAVGSGWHYPILQSFVNTNSVTDASLDCACLSAYDIAELAIKAYKNGHLVSPLEAEPTYLRNEISWKKRKRIRMD